MIWKNARRLRTYIKSSLWLVPFFAIPLELATSRALHWLDAQLKLTVLGYAASGARAALETVVTANLSFVVFTFGSLLVAIQVASAQLTSRIIATTLLQDRVVKTTLFLFLFTLLFALSALNRMDEAVHELVVFFTAVLGLASFGAFLYLIDYTSRLLRPISILIHVGNRGLAVIGDVYPDLSINPEAVETQRHTLGSPDHVITHRGRSGIVLATDLKTLTAKAERSNGIIEFVPQVGDFVSADDVLFNLYGAARAANAATLRAAVAIGSERTMEQDPTFAFRIVIDIALKALSPAINDPTTAVLAIDQLHRLLRKVGRRHLRNEEILDRSGKLRMIFRTPNWEDFVDLSFSEIRSCGANNLQIVRRLRAMIGDLVKTLLPHRHAALHEQLSLLDREVKRHFSYPEELKLALVADTQGLGGRSGDRT